MKSSAQHDQERVIAISQDRPIRSLLGVLGMHRARFTVLLVAYVIKDAPLWVLPILTGAIIDIVSQRGSLTALWGFAIAAALVLAQNYPVGIFYNDQFSRIYRQVGADLRNALVLRLQNLSIGFHSRASASIIQTKVVRDVESVEQMLQQAFPPIVSAACVLIGAITMTAIQVPAFVAVFAVTIPIGVTLVVAIRRASERRNELFRRQVETFSARVGEMATLMPITRAHGLERVATGRVVDSARVVQSAGHSLDQLNGRFGAVSWLAFQFLAAFCLVAAAAASLSGVLEISPGQVVLLSSYFAILTGAIVQILNLTPVLARGRESLRSIAEVLEEPDVELNSGKHAVPVVRGDIRLENVSFGFENDPRLAVDDVSLHIRPGETVAFVGPSGAGKSTLVNLVLGFVRPSSGRVLLDGADMAQLDLRTARAWFSIVPQDSVLFEGTVRENITYGLGTVSDGRVARALHDANAQSIVDGMPHGLETVVGERGARLSGGQRQRLAIARALVRDPRVLLLDEATSALDSESEHAIKEALDRLRAGRTTLIVAHRLSTVRSADRIVVLDAGRVVEIGTHDELIAQHGTYERLYLAQRL